MNKHHFIVSLALVVVIMVGSLGLASCGPQLTKNYNSEKSNTSAMLNPDEVDKLDVDGLRNLINDPLDGFSEDEKDEFFRDEFLRTKDYNESKSNTFTLSTPVELADFVIGELNNFSEDELKEFFTAELGGFSADLIQKRQVIWKGQEKAAPATLKDLGVDDAGAQRILDAFDDEILAYKDYNEAKSNTAAAMKRAGVSDADAERIMGDIVLIDEGGRDSAVSVYWYDWTMPDGRWCLKMVVIDYDTGQTWSYTTCSEPSVLLMDDSDVENFVRGEIGIEGEYISIGSEDLLDSVEYLAQAAKNYNSARSNTIARIEEAGMTDDAKIEEILDALYEPISAADATEEKPAVETVSDTSFQIDSFFDITYELYELSIITISFEAMDLTGGQNPVTNVILIVNGEVWHNSGAIAIEHYQNSVEREVEPEETLDIKLIAVNLTGQSRTTSGSITTPTPSPATPAPPEEEQAAAGP